MLLDVVKNLVFHCYEKKSSDADPSIKGTPGLDPERACGVPSLTQNFIFRNVEFGKFFIPNLP